MERKALNFLSAEEKIGLLKEHLVAKVPVAELCDKYKIAPSVLWGWQKTLFNEGAQLLVRKKSHCDNLKLKRAELRIAQLEEKLKQKNDVIAELMQDHIELKKKLNGGN